MTSRTRNLAIVVGPMMLSIALLAQAGCSGDEDGSRDRFHEAIVEQDLVGAREAALELGLDLPDTPAAVIEVARMLADIGEMNEARWMLQTAVARHPGHADLIVGLAETSLLVGDAASAQAALDTLPPDTERARHVAVLRARSHVMMGRLEEGLAVLIEAEQLHDEPVLFRSERIDLLTIEARYDEALGIVREMQADPAVPETSRLWLAMRESDLIQRIEGGEAALPHLDAILEADPGFVDAARSRTSILITLGRAPEAQADIEATLEAHPQIAALHGVAAQAAMASGDVDATELHLRRHAEAEPTAASLAALAQYLYQQGQAREAAAVLENVPASADPVHRIELEYQRIAMQIDSGDLAEARSAIQAFALDHPTNPRVDYLLARLDLAEGRPEEAARRLALVVSRLDRTDVGHLLGLALEQSGDLEGAEVRYGIVATQGGVQVPSWAGLLRVLEAQQKWERLASAALVAARIAPLHDVALHALATSRIARGQLEEAEFILRAHSTDSPELVEPRIGLSMALRRQGRFDEALRALDEARDEQQLDPRLVAERATVLGASGRATEALAVLEAAASNDASNTQATSGLRNTRIYLLFASGRADAALEAAARTVALAPEDPTPHRMAADYLASTGQFEASYAHYQRALEIAPAAGDVWFRMAIALERAGRDGEAAEAYLQATELDDQAIGARNNLALVLGRQGRTREAIEVAQAAYARAENDPVVIDTLASLYLEAGLYRRAAAMLEKAHELAPDSEDVPFHLALAYRDMGRPEEARQLLTGLNARVGTEHALHGRIEDALASLP